MNLASYARLSGFLSYDLHLDQMTLTTDSEPDILNTYLCSAQQIKVLGKTFQKLEHRTDRQTD